MPAKNAWNARQSWGHKPGIELIKANQQGTIHKAASKNHEGPNCTPVIPVAQNSRENSGTSPSSDLLPELKGKWQQRPETPALIRRIHTSSSHHTPHQCSDSAEKWIRPGSNHPPRRCKKPRTITAKQTVENIAANTTNISKRQTGHLSRHDVRS